MEVELVVESLRRKFAADEFRAVRCHRIDPKHLQLCSVARFVDRPAMKFHPDLTQSPHKCQIDNGRFELGVQPVCPCPTECCENFL